MHAPGRPVSPVPTQVEDDESGSSQDQRANKSAGPSSSPKQNGPTDHEQACGGDADSSEEEQDALEAERLDFGTIYTKTTQDKTQPVKTLDWKLVDPKTLDKSCVRSKVDGAMGTEYGAQLLNLGGKSITTIHGMWKHLIPPMWITKFVSTANLTLQEKPIDRNYRLTTEAEVEAILGEALAAAVASTGSFEKCFSISHGDNPTLFPAPAFGQFGITKNRAKIIMRAMHLSDGPQKPAGEKDTHWFMDSVLSQFNAHLKNSFRASWLSCMDETGPAWHGGEGENDFNKCPHLMYIQRKPEPVCAEFNDICCANARVLNYIEYEKAAKYHADAKYMDKVGTYNAAMTARLVEPIAHSNAAAYGDSRFGSVKAANFCWTELEIHTAFDVKSGTALFPRKELARICPKPHGSIVVMTAKINDLTLYAIGQRRGPSVHTFLSTFGTFIDEIPARFPNISNIKDAPWTTPGILNKVTQAQPGIDTINRQLFDQLGMQYTFVTRCFETRFSQHFMLPLTYVNAINATKYFFPAVAGEDNTKGLLMRLAYEMVHNPAWLAQRKAGTAGGGDSGSGAGTSRSGARYQESNTTWQQCRIDGGPPTRESPGKHTLILLSQLEGYKGGRQQRCWECNDLVSWCCARCSTPNCPVPLHPLISQGAKRSYRCLHMHRANPAGGYKVTHEKCSGTDATSKRRRKVNIEFI